MTGERGGASQVTPISTGRTRRPSQADPRAASSDVFAVHNVQPSHLPVISLWALRRISDVSGQQGPLPISYILFCENVLWWVRG